MAYITRSGSEFTFNLPGVMGSGIMPSQVEMVCEHPHTEVRYRFTMMVWHGTSGRSESFEWRRSSGNEVKSLGGSSSGWKLVRLGSNSGAGFPPPYQQHGINNNATPQYHYGYPQQNASSYDEKPEPGFSSDGNEVVAVFAPAKTFSFSMTDVGKFQYMRSGATPTMGYHWALMAVLSGVCVYQHQLARANNATGSTAAASAAGAVVGAVAGV
ncbi:hypothetical protein B0T10DRAFT_482108 [Thelonectria olida]|uniref:Uncharacterized protein n=1 Tax=Thelonectria olida TaxID=1576542 RepID=A0A9P9ARV4_9HYPO|nr:hypothetical protein B0T10DRAFT_482108 [Thelonectria olida]